MSHHTPTPAYARKYALATGRDSDQSPTCFSKLRWAATLLHSDAHGLVIYETANGRRMAAIQEHVTDDASLELTTYRAIGKHAMSALAHNGTTIHPEHSTAWQRHNVLYAPHTDLEGRAGLLHISAALAIMHTRGDIGTARPPLKPVEQHYRFAPRYENSIAAAYASATAGTDKLAVVNTSHLREDTTDIEAFLVPDIASAEPYTDIHAALPDNPDSYVSMSMFGRPTPSTEEYISRMIASAVFMVNEYRQSRDAIHRLDRMNDMMAIEE